VNVWLSRLRPNLKHGAARHDLRNVYDLHRRVMTLVPDNLGEQARRVTGLLFRVEHTARGPQVLVQTQVAPDFGRLPEGYADAEGPRRLDPFLRELHAGALVRYRIAGNPSKRRGNSSIDLGKPGQIVPLRGADAEQWWIRKAEKHGLHILSLIARPVPDARGNKNGAQIKHAITQFDGVARITDPDLVRAAVLSGIGRGKSYGCGLLSLAPLKVDR
jgi:CRISPR system Cascade subunit CasE